jgi:Protein of unknown function (DUF3040)
MPLSEHEKRSLDQISQNLTLEDPQLASSLGPAQTRSWRIRRLGRPSRMLAGIGTVLIGLTALLIGVRANNSLGDVIGVAGGIVVVAATTLTLEDLRRC